MRCAKARRSSTPEPCSSRFAIVSSLGMKDVKKDESGDDIERSGVGRFFTSGFGLQTSLHSPIRPEPSHGRLFESIDRDIHTPQTDCRHTHATTPYKQTRTMTHARFERDAELDDGCTLNSFQGRPPRAEDAAVCLFVVSMYDTIGLLTESVGWATIR